jgi:hypothetical protein
MIVGAGINILRGIEELRHRYIFVRDSFRHDVAEVALQDVDRRNDWRRLPPRKPRIALSPETKATATVSTKGLGSIVCGLLNISPGGCSCLLNGKGPAKGTQLDMVITGLPQQKIEVVWKGDDMTGFKFIKPLSPGRYDDKELTPDEYYDLLTALSTA